MSHAPTGSATPTPGLSETPTELDEDKAEAAAAKPYLDQVDSLSSAEDADEWLKKVAGDLDDTELELVVNKLQERFPDFAQREAEQ
jgi:hypothetical protein